MKRFTGYAWFVVGYTVLVIMWGAFVRATGSGAGCGRHWPRCNGEIIPRPESVATLIEFSHRITSSLAGVFVIILLVWAYRSFPARSLTRRGALLSFIFILIEGALGAGLVLLELVEDNASVLRAVAVGVHLLNTFILLLWMVLTAWSSSAEKTEFRSSPTSRMLIGSLIILAILSSAGSITALGDTLFLSGSLARQFGEQNAAEHFLVQLRVIHPTLAVFVALYLLFIGFTLSNQNPPHPIKPLLYGMMTIVCLQTLLGVMTIVLQAPVVLQLSHLMFADALWITLLVLTFEVLSKVRSEVPEEAVLQAA